MTLTAEENERLTRVGPGTPMGELLRRYWHPVAASAELPNNPTKAVRLLCEDLVLYKDRSGTLGYRELLMEQMEKVARGEDPMEVYRDPAKNKMITMPHEEERMEDRSSFDQRERHQRGARTQVNEQRMRFGPERFSLVSERMRAAKLEARQRIASGETPPLPGTVREPARLIPNGYREATIMPDRIRRS